MDAGFASGGKSLSQSAAVFVEAAQGCTSTVRPLSDPPSPDDAQAPISTEHANTPANFMNVISDLSLQILVMELSAIIP